MTTTKFVTFDISLSYLLEKENEEILEKIAKSNNFSVEKLREMFSML